jgi:hypothetical protein
MKKSIRKPENWQDFESLCKKLWGEVWGIPNKIKKNGRSGQIQSGIDVYGKPVGESTYFGIQCKGKDEYSHTQLTRSEIDREIKKAQGFTPSLGTLIFATTANKDVKIEEYIRIKDAEEKFEILLFCWEDITDLIEENRLTFNWYVKEIQHISKYDFTVIYENFNDDFILVPNFRRITRIFEYEPQSLDDFLKETRKTIEELNKEITDFKKGNIDNSATFLKLLGHSDKVNKSWFKFKIIEVFT